MQHRHITTDPSQPPSLTAIHDIMERGTLDDWVELARLVQSDLAFCDKVYRFAVRAGEISEEPGRTMFWQGFCRESARKANEAQNAP